MVPFAGYWLRTPPGPATLERAAAKLRRKPEDLVAAWTSPQGNAGLAVRGELAASASGRVRCAFDGELFNRHDVRKFVVSRTRTLKTESNAELLANLWEAKGRDMMMSLRGSFAMAAWDDSSGSLFLARDAMGHRPLYVAHRPDGILFANDLPPRRAPNGEPPALETRALDYFLAYHCAPLPLTLFRGVRKIPPACWLETVHGKLEEGQYWTPSYYDTTGQNQEEIAQYAFSYLFESVKAHTRDLDLPIAYLEGDPFGAVLAGLASLAKRGKLRTFSLSHPAAPSQARDAALVSAKRFGTDHREENSAEPIRAVLDAIADVNVEALPTSRMAPAMLYARSAGAGDPGAILAAGGELFVLSGRRAAPAPTSTLGLWRRMKEQVETKAALSDEVAREMANRTVFAEEERSRLVKGPTIPAVEALQEIARRAPMPGDAHVAAYIDAVAFLPELFLGPWETCCASQGLAVRAPLADPSAVQLLVPVVHALAERQPLRGLRRIFESLVPEDAFWEARWATPDDWEAVATRELSARACDLLSETRTIGRGLLDAKELMRLVEDQRRGAKNDRKLLLLHALETWMRRFVDAKP
jgi:asparagine synthase (glutamine-hydrolysing)